jgi:polyhydroxyalkanoate synthesis regulator phasin
MSTQILKEIAQCGRPWAAERAQYALEIAAAVHEGAISMDEFQELMQDLVRTDKLDAEADDMETKAALVQAVYVVGQLV